MLDVDSSVLEGVDVHQFMNMNNVNDVTSGQSNGFWLYPPLGAFPQRKLECKYGKEEAVTEVMQATSCDILSLLLVSYNRISLVFLFGQ